MNLTEKENQLLEVAIQVIDLNRNIWAALTGSLMLAVRGIEKNREANDIDIICGCLCEIDEGLPIVPEGFKQTDMDGRKSQVDSISFENSEGIKIDFLFSEEKTEDVEGVQCGNVSDMMIAKNNYSLFDLSPESKLKHTQDLDFHFQNIQ